MQQLQVVKGVPVIDLTTDDADDPPNCPSLNTGSGWLPSRPGAPRAPQRCRASHVHNDTDFQKDVDKMIDMIVHITEEAKERKEAELQQTNKRKVADVEAYNKEWDELFRAKVM